LGVTLTQRLVEGSWKEDVTKAVEVWLPDLH
jgi:hypothetical protein